MREFFGLTEAWASANDACLAYRTLQSVDCVEPTLGLTFQYVK